jgi:hypothetical protein
MTIIAAFSSLISTKQPLSRVPPWVALGIALKDGGMHKAFFHQSSNMHRPALILND